MKLLAIETSTEACSAALLVNGDISERYELAPKIHTKLLLAMIDELMSDAELKPQQLDAIAFSRGPGSFTGVRIATGVMQGIAFGAELPVVPVSTLAALAQDFINQHPHNVVFTAMDARMGEIFWSVYQRNKKGIAELFSAEHVIAPGDITVPQLFGAGVGSGWGVYRAVLMAKMGEKVVQMASEALPRASAIAQLGEYGFNSGLAVAVEQAMPVYLRDKVAKTEAERRAV